MKKKIVYIGICFLYLFITSCTTIVERYKPETPWANIDGFYTVEQLPAYEIEQTGKLQQFQLTVNIVPKMNYYSYYIKTLLFEESIIIFERDFAAFLAYCNKYLEWEKQAKELDVSLNKKIGDLTTLFVYQWAGNNKAILSESTFEISFASSSKNEYYMKWSFDTLKPYYDKTYYQGNLPAWTWYFDKNSVERIITYFDDRFIKENVNKAIEAQKEKDNATEKEKEDTAKQKEIDDLFN